MRVVHRSSSAHSAHSGQAADPEQGAPSTRSDPWSAHMREKYGLDTSQFTYNPDAGQSSDHASGRPDVTNEPEPKKSSYCIIM